MRGWALGNVEDHHRQLEDAGITHISLPSRDHPFVLVEVALW
jgi:hypothetical protein